MSDENSANDPDNWAERTETDLLCITSLPHEATVGHSEPPASEVARDALAHDLQQKLLGVDALHALLGSASHYKLLGVSPAATSRDVREAYFNCVRCFHPDTFVGCERADQRTKLHAVFAALTEAYEVLRREGTRAHYDDAIELAAHERHGAVREAQAREKVRDLEREWGPSTGTSSAALTGSVLPASADSPPSAGAPRGTMAPPRASMVPPRPSMVPPRASMVPPRPSMVPPRPSMAPPRASMAPRATMAPERPSVAPARASQAPERPSMSPPRPSLQGRPATAARSGVLESRPVVPPRERASAAARAERDFVVDDEREGNTPSHRASYPGPSTGSMRNPFAQDSQPAGSFEEEVRRSSTLLRELDLLAQQRLRDAGDLPEPRVGLLEIASQVRGGGGISKWAAQRLAEAHQAEQAGRVVDAATILRSVHNQLKDPNIEAHAQRLARLAAHRR